MSESRRDRGTALVWVAILGFVLIGIVGLSADWGKVAYNVHELQNAADAGALAGAQWVKVKQTTARDRAQQLCLSNHTERIPVQIDRNEENAEAGDLVIGRWDRLARTFTPTLMNPNAVKVVGRRITGSPDGPVAMIFGHLAGVDTADITREAIARSIGATGGAVICLAPDGVGLHGNGNITISVNFGDIQVNSAGSSVVDVRGSAGFLDCDILKVCGDVRFNGSRDLSTEPYEAMIGARGDDVPPVEDPLKDLPEPQYAAWPRPADKSPYEPGYYPNGISPKGNVIFKPGLYALGGQGLTLKGKTTVRAIGVMLFFVGSATIDMRGTGGIVLRPPGCEPPPSDPYPAWQDWQTYTGVSIFQSRTDSGTARLRGNKGLDATGTLYFPAGTVDASGTPALTGNQLICWRLDVGGNSSIVIDYDGRNVIRRFRSLLVE